MAVPLHIRDAVPQVSILWATILIPPGPPVQPVGDGWQLTAASDAAAVRNYNVCHAVYLKHAQGRASRAALVVLDTSV